MMKDLDDFLCEFHTSENTDHKKIEVDFGRLLDICTSDFPLRNLTFETSNIQKSPELCLPTTNFKDNFTPISEFEKNQSTSQNRECENLIADNPISKQENLVWINSSLWSYENEKSKLNNNYCRNVGDSAQNQSDNYFPDSKVTVPSKENMHDLLQNKYEKKYEFNSVTEMHKPTFIKLLAGSKGSINDFKSSAELRLTNNSLNEMDSLFASERNLKMVEKKSSLSVPSGSSTSVMPKSFLVKLYIVRNDSHLGPISFEVYNKMTLRLLKLKVEKELTIKASTQKWIFGNTLAIDDEIPLYDYNVLPNCTIFLYVDAHHSQDLKFLGATDPVCKETRNSLLMTNVENEKRGLIVDVKIKKNGKEKNVHGLKDSLDSYKFAKNILVHKYDALGIQAKSDSDINASLANEECKPFMLMDENIVEKVVNTSPLDGYVLSGFEANGKSEICQSKKSLKIAHEKANILLFLNEKIGCYQSENPGTAAVTYDYSPVPSFHQKCYDLPNSGEVDTSEKLEKSNFFMINKLKSQNTSRRFSDTGSLPTIKSDSRTPKKSILKRLSLQLRSQNNSDNNILPTITATAECSNVNHNLGNMDETFHDAVESCDGTVITSNDCFSVKPDIEVNNMDDGCNCVKVEDLQESEDHNVIAENDSINVSKGHDAKSDSGLVTADYNHNENNISLCINEVIPSIAEQSKDEECDVPKQTPQEQALELIKNYEFILKIEKLDLVENLRSFNCPVCFGDFESGQGVVLHECLHVFCKECLKNSIEFAQEACIKCPFRDNEYSCESYLQQREIKALVSPDTYEKYLQRSIKTAESLAEKSFHCLTPDCPGWCMFEDNVNIFRCPVCHHFNCLNCCAIHEGLNCRQYQDKLKKLEKVDHDAEKTFEFLNKMIESGKAVKCPKCDLVLMKKWGCDWLKCSICTTEICWVTRGPRWGPAGQGDTSGGCRCGVNGVKCHPSCTYCH